MSHVLKLDVPSEIYESLRQIAERAGQSPEVVAVKWLAAVMDSLGQISMMLTLDRLLRST